MGNIQNGPPAGGFHIGGRHFPSKVVMAPMAGLTNGPFRRIANEAGCLSFWTEMITAEGLVRRRGEVEKMLPDKDDPHPIAVQLFGSDPESMARAASMAEGSGADVIDINMACPVRRITRNGAGAAFMRNPASVTAIVGEVEKAVRIPVTVKIRAGWDSGSLNSLEVARAAAGAGAAAIVIHGRTRAQGYSGRADHGHAVRLAEGINVPVIVSGDMNSGEDAREVMRDTGAAAVMIGRASIGNPWIYKRVGSCIGEGDMPPDPADEEKLDLIIRHLDLLERKFGETRGVRLFRAHLVGYVRGRPDASRWRRELLTEKRAAILRERLSELFSRTKG